jgi:hypothetical protein
MDYWRYGYVDFAGGFDFKYIWRIDDDSHLLAPLAIQCMEHDVLDIAGAKISCFSS